MGRFFVCRGTDPRDCIRNFFDAFYQGSNTANGHVRGTGLGLSIAREYAQAHGGYIEVIDGESDGACLRVVLPLEQAEEASA